MNSSRPDLSDAIEPPADVAEALAATRAARGAFGATLHYFSRAGSTNDLAAALADGGAPEGATVVAEAQTAGRGRLGRTWFSPPGAGLYVSVVIRPAASAGAAEPAGGGGGQGGVSPTLPSALTLAAGVALAEAVRESTGLAAEIKWPNDLVFRRRKIAGILAEASARGTGVEYVVLGFGVNVRAVAFPPEVAARATAIEAELGRQVDRGLILARALARLAACVDDVRRGRMSAVLDRWRALSPSAIGARVEWQGPDGPVRGRTAGLDADGALLVERDGGVMRVVAGEVVWL